MKIGIWNLESKYKNLALEKVRLYHQSRGDEIEDNMFLGYETCDLIYCSAIFDWTPLLPKYQSLPFGAISTGGTGFSLETKLPAEIDVIEPRQNFGFTTRGCIRHCPFCVVPQKEGAVRVVGDLFLLWDCIVKDVVLYDNNILALPEHFALICQQARDNRLRLDFNQGLDHRLLTPEIVDLMKSIRHKEYRFAFDGMHLFNSVERAIDLLQRKGINRCDWYVLVGYDTTLEDDLRRLNYLRERNQIAFVQQYRQKGQKPNRKLAVLARWVNQHHIFRGMTWEQWLNHPDNKWSKAVIRKEDD